MYNYVTCDDDVKLCHLIFATPFLGTEGLLCSAWRSIKRFYTNAKAIIYMRLGKGS